MNQEQIKKHGKVIKWFCDNPEKGVWMKGSANHWTINRNPEFDTETNMFYVQNDEYAELRKAQADGKKIEYFNASKSKPIINFHGQRGFFLEVNKFDKDLSMYRVKPEELKFKVGDWVISPDGKIKYLYKNCIVIEEQLDDWELWQPKTNKWNIFWNDTTNYIIDKLSKKDNHVNPYITKRNGRFTNVAPLEFIDKLKAQNESR